MHVVLDQHNGGLRLEAFDEVHDLFGIGGTHTGKWFIEQQEFGARGQGQCDFYAPLFAIGQGLCQLLLTAL